jgi:dipeptidyl aminopeptidase/acylaminoacyl peptidase
MYRKKLLFITLMAVVFVGVHTATSQVSLNELLSYPYPTNLCSSPASEKLAWTFIKKGIHNIFITEDHGHTFKQLTHYKKDDGQAISALQFSPDGRWLVYMKGGGPHGNWTRNKPVNPTSSPAEPKFQLYSLDLLTGREQVLATGQSSNQPAISPDSKKVVYVNNGTFVIVPIDGSKEGQQMFFAKGDCDDPEWSPDGTKLAFVSDRVSHSFIGIYTNSDTPIKWIDPAFSKDASPVWSPNGDSIAFVRRPASGGAPDSILSRHIQPWEIRVADARTGASTRIWKSPATFDASVPTTDGGYNLHWAAKDRIIFLSTQDNWPHLYSIPSKGGKPLLLTPGPFMVEYINISPDKKQLVFSANTGPDKLDIDRRHIGLVSVDNSDMKILTPGDGIEAHPVFIDKETLSFISSTPYRPALPAVYANKQKKIQLIGNSMLSDAYSPKELVRPKQVIFESLDGTPIHGQLFERPGGKAKKPAILCLHGGPMRQMLLGWNYSDYYAAHYAVNQWLANHGFVVLSINYRMGIGYGNNFHHPPHAGRNGASEYQDVLAAGQWLSHQSYVDAGKIGVYGGSYGGYLTAFALGRNSDIFAAGVDISGVHSQIPDEAYTSRIEQAPDAEKADSVVLLSSPIAYTGTWKSPVLIIHADDDRNVDFDQSINLFNRLKKAGVSCETLVIPDDTHHWLRFSNLCKVYDSTVDFLVRKLMPK